MAKVKARIIKLVRMEKNFQLLILEEEIGLVDFEEYRVKIGAERARL
jgi:hypothetical protein